MYILNFNSKFSAGMADRLVDNQVEGPLSPKDYSQKFFVHKSKIEKNPENHTFPQKGPYLGEAEDGKNYCSHKKIKNFTKFTMSCF